MNLQIRVKNTPVTVNLTGRGNILCLVNEYPKSASTRKAIETEARSYHKHAGRVMIRATRGVQ